MDIQDPYNWLENNSEETDAWVSSQAKFTEQYLSKVSDRDKLREEMKKNMDYAKVRLRVTCWPGMRYLPTSAVQLALSRER